jgi:hypothetical protein
MPSDQCEVVWVAPETESRRVAAAATHDGGVAAHRGKWVSAEDPLDDDGERMEPLMAVGLIVATGWLITRISGLLADHLRPGSQIVDMRTTPPVILVARHIRPPGTLVVLKTVNGQPEERRYEPEQRDEALSILRDLFRRNA